VPLKALKVSIFRNSNVMPWLASGMALCGETANFDKRHLVLIKWCKVSGAS
jgi:hypothetical protein